MGRSSAWSFAALAAVIVVVAALSVWSSLSHRSAVRSTGRELDAAIVYGDMRQAVLDARYHTANYLREPTAANLDSLEGATFRIFDLARKLAVAGDESDAAFSRAFLSRYELSAENALGSFARFLNADLDEGSAPADQLGPMLPQLDERIRQRHALVRERVDAASEQDEGHIGSTIVLAAIGLALTGAIGWLVAAQLRPGPSLPPPDEASPRLDELERSERRFRTLVRHSNDVILVADQFGTVRFVSPSVASVLGYSPEELAGVNVASSVHPMDVVKSLEWGAGVLARPGEHADPVVFRLQRKDGAYVHVELRAINLIDDPDVGGILVTGRDVSHELAATVEGARLTAVVDATSDMVVVTDADGAILHVNRAARARLGGEGVIGQNIFQFLPEDARSLIDDQAAPEAEAYGSWTGELTIPVAGGRLINLEIELLAHLGASGEVEFYSCIARDVSERRRFESQLLHLANHDPLTGLFNRRAFEERVEKEAARCRTGAGEAALYFLDLDNFKAVNDGLGHHVGDELLQHVARVLGATLPEDATLARIGGDEFGILVPVGSPEEAEAYAAQVRGAIRQVRFVAAGGHVSVTTSIGVVLMPHHGATTEAALANADLAMYQAKRRGDSWQFYSSDAFTIEEMTNRANWEQRIREAIDDDGYAFVLFSQPILTTNGTKVADELLIRMRDEAGNVIDPGLFLPVAEQSSLITLIDRWVIRRAIALLASPEPFALDLAVNLSARSFQDREFPLLIRRWSRESGADLRRLLIEITEAAAVADVEEAREFVSQLSQAGIRFSIDDFGAGFASFSQVRDLPIQRIKIDGAFIRNLAHNSDDRHLVAAIVEMAHGIGKEVVAECVEDAATLAIVGQLGVDYVQGYLFGLPVEVPVGAGAPERLSA